MVRPRSGNELLDLKIAHSANRVGEEGCGENEQEFLEIAHLSANDDDGAHEKELTQGDGDYMDDLE